MVKIVSLEKYFYVILLFLTLSFAEEFYDLRAQRFCKRHCYHGFILENIACGCEEAPPIPGLHVVEDNLIEFREAVLDAFNSFRNKVAQGIKIKDGDIPPSSDIPVLNYNVGLEYMARCAVKRGLIHLHEFCFKDKTETGVSPFVTYLDNENKNPPNISNVKTAINYLNRHFDDFPNEVTVESYKLLVDKVGLAFGNPLFRHNVRVGCARQLYPNATPIMRPKQDTVAIFCLFTCRYGRLGAFYPFRASNRFENIMGREGEPCSYCQRPFIDVSEIPKMTKCNEKYTSLCGTLYPVPKYKWKNGPDPDQPFRSKSVSNINICIPFVTTMLTLQLLNDLKRK